MPRIARGTDAKSGVKAATIKKFERTGRIQLHLLVQLTVALGADNTFDQVLEVRRWPGTPAELGRRIRFRQRGWKPTRRRGRV